MDSKTSNVCQKILSILVLVLLNISIGKAQTDTAYEIGKIRFRTYCSSCHAVHREVYGPMLASITKKKERSWLVPFIQNSQSVIHSGDPYATSLFKKFNSQVMPSFEFLSKEDILAVLHYIEVESLHPDVHFNDAEVSGNAGSSVLQGKKEFLDHCSMCHFIHKESYFAPALGSVSKRHSTEWLVSFIQNSQKKIKEHDPYAENLYQAFDQHVMTTMEFLDEKEIKSILTYIEYASTQNAAYKNQLGKLESTAERSRKTDFYSAIAVVLWVTMMVIVAICCYLLVRTMQHINKN